MHQDFVSLFHRNCLAAFPQAVDITVGYCVYASGLFQLQLCKSYRVCKGLSLSMGREIEAGDLSGKF